MARPETVTLEKMQAVAARMALGLTLEQACLCEGIKPKTASNKATLHPEFRELVKKAHAEKEQAWVTAIESGSTNWQSRAWLLERVPHCREKYAKPDGPIVIASATATAAGIVTPEQMQQVAQVAGRLFTGNGNGNGHSNGNGNGHAEAPPKNGKANGNGHHA